MSLPNRPTAIFVTDPALGEGLAVEALRMGVRIPRELSVVGFDDSKRRFATFPRLSSICQNTDLLGRTAIQHLLEIIAKTAQPQRLRLECCFEPLDSTAPPMEQD
jgi:DNA-binding LacI/PurR family transcriptional regulator